MRIHVLASLRSCGRCPFALVCAAGEPIRTHSSVKVCSRCFCVHIRDRWNIFSSTLGWSGKDDLWLICPKLREGEWRQGSVAGTQAISVALFGEDHQFDPQRRLGDSNTVRYCAQRWPGRQAPRHPLQEVRGLIDDVDGLPGPRARAGGSQVAQSACDCVTYFEESEDHDVETH